ncbi:unnamed protein product [Cercopithifilaria johnstoni]|uniref:Uncharacterized protein n=1 Tax=Cercopithifilaria johnstoni TaxID=2874296 RepID=A0A8J2PYQ9_9BILA|nr:unnamed protein product [Cercopithifilaria johnstoni]
MHGYKCSIALNMSMETLNRSEESSESTSPEKEWPFRLQREKSFTNFKFTRFLGQEYICERGPVEEEELTKTKESAVLEDSPAFPIKRYYIGIVTPETAELFVSRNTAFRVYHSLKEIINKKISLCIVYKNSCGNFYHYLIKERYDKNLRTRLLYVDYGDEAPPEFISIGALIKHYTIYASLHSFSLASGLSVDVFPWWN